MRAAARAKTLLRSASRHLRTVDPSQELGNILDDALSLPAGHSAYRQFGMNQEAPLFEPHYNESAGDTLSLAVSPLGPTATPADRAEGTTEAMRHLVGKFFGREAMRWLDSRTEPVRGRHARSQRFGGYLGSSFDQNGLSESYVCMEWGPQLLDALPQTLYRLTRVAMEALPGLRPSLTTIRCGRASGSQQVTLQMDKPLALGDLQPLMEQLGLGQQHASLMSACAFVLGARFVLPAECCSLTLRPTRDGVELRLNVNLDLVSDAPSQMMSLLRLQMSERPRSLRELDKWVAALTPEGYESPGAFSVLAIRVRPNLPARIALFLEPAAVVEMDDVHAGVA
jgi:hypothetical protein